MPVRSESFWVGNLAMTAALAARAPDPKPLLKQAVREFLAAHPPGNALGDMIRKEGKP